MTDVTPVPLDESYLAGVRKGLDAAREGADSERFDPLTGRIVVFSDHHKGTGDTADDFRNCEHAYTTALDACIVIPDMTQRCCIRLPRSGFTDGKAGDGWTSPCFSFIGYHRPQIHGGTFLRGYGPAIGLSGTYGAEVWAPDIRRLENNPSQGQYGYGVANRGWATRVHGLTHV